MSCDVEQVIHDYIASEFVFDDPRATFHDDTPLIEQGIIDSLAIFLLIAFLEKEFGLKVEPEDVMLENFRTVSAIGALVRSKRAALRPR